jgi:hypothetical protein
LGSASHVGGLADRTDLLISFSQRLTLRGRP